MAWRCVIIDSPCKVSVANNYLIVRTEQIKQIHLPEISFLMLACPAINITGVALYELSRNKIKVVFCDEKRNPYGEIVNLYGSHNCAKQLKKQLAWDTIFAAFAAAKIISNKIYNQATLLTKLGFDERARMLTAYADEVLPADSTNREGHAAKVYFNTLFGLDFSRDKDCSINAALNYGYSVLLSLINREIVNCGRLTQLGIHHCNEFNQFNLSCDFMEPFRVIIDEFVYEHKDCPFDKNYKFSLVNTSNKRITFAGKEYVLNDAVSLYVKAVLDCLDNHEKPFPVFEFK